MKVLCTGCDAELDPLDTQCVVCLRRRSAREIARGLRRQSISVRAAEALSGKAARKLFLGLLGLGCAGYLLATYKPPPAPPLVSTADPPVQQAASQPQAQPASAAAASPKPAPAPKGPWSIRGRAYDLLSLKPVAGAQITFLDANAERKFQCRTDAQGRYRISLPRIRSGGYEVFARHKRYGRIFYDEMSPPYHQQSLARRREAQAMLGELKVLHVPILLSPRESELEYNLIFGQPQ